MWSEYADDTSDDDSEKPPLLGMCSECDRNIWSTIEYRIHHGKWWCTHCLDAKFAKTVPPQTMVCANCTHSYERHIVIDGFTNVDPYCTWWCFTNARDQWVKRQEEEFERESKGKQ